MKSFKILFVLSCFFLASCSKSSTATPPATSYTLTITSSPTNGGSLSTSNTNVTMKLDGAVTTATAVANTSASLTATPKLGFIFKGWTGDITDTSSTITVTFDKNIALTATFSTAPAGVVQKTLDGFKSKFKTGGTIALARKSDGTLDFGTFGNSEKDVPLSINMSLGVGSITKTFTAALIFKLIEENKLKLTDKLSALLPERVNANINGDITVKQLLNHSSGLHDPIEILIPTVFSNPSKAYSIDEIFSYVVTPTFAAGTTHGYSNTNYTLLGLIIEKVTSKKYHEYLREQILDPLKLSNTFLNGKETPSSNITLGYSWAPDGTSLDKSFSRVGIESLAWSAGSVFSTLEDMAKWYQALFNGDFINASSLQEMQSAVTVGDLSYGHGIFVNQFSNGLKLFSHNGQTIAFNSFCIYNVSTKDIIIVIVNQTENNPVEIALSILTEISK